MISSVPHNLPIEDGRFKFYQRTDRIESSIDFVMSSYEIVREYNDGFSTKFLWDTIQAPTSLLTSAQAAFLLRLEALLTDSVPFLAVEDSSFSRSLSGDRKASQLSLSYRNVEPEEENNTPNLFVRFL